MKIITHDGKRAQSRPLSLGRLKINDVKRDAALLWDHLVVLATDNKALALAATEIGPKRIGTLATVGELPKAQLPEQHGNVTAPRVDGCRAGGAIVVRASAGRDEFVSFWLNGRWTAPLRTATAGGVLTCHAGEAVLTRIDAGTGEIALDARLSHQRCTPTECKSKALVVREVLAGQVGLAPSTPIRALGLDGKLLLIWLAGQRGGLRMRLADVESIATTADVLLYDDLSQGGRIVDSSTLNEMLLLPGDHFAVLLMATPAGLRGLRIGADGKATPLKL